ncbi:replication termination factor 2 isoform X2 [Sphaerodactylus townsendi]|uniref:replication termination factor 2 isoform X2 n=1 Tax=Sphaerodactylus townsendi TaxID=933632 RepID=UPI0020276354|nr:replication termination factor 2 isoform X2 [Sphaerodactylus townsendi]
MGCDGGTIPKRHELVKGPRKVEKVDKNAELVAQWYYCTLSQEKLNRPIVACELGRLYNKDAIIEFLLDKSSEKAIVEAASHIRSIKNVIELNLTDNPAWTGDKGNTKGDKYDDIQSARFICPIVGLEMNGRHRFCFLRNCGCVFSERALKEIKTEACHKCSVPFEDGDVIVLNGTKEDVEVLKKRMEDRRLKSKLGKKSKKPKAAETIVKSSTVEESPGPSTSSAGQDSANINSGEKRNIAFCKGTAEESTLSSSEKESKNASGPLKRSAANKEEKSEAYKSIFTSHSSAKRSKEQSSNWITHTAYYF